MLRHRRRFRRTAATIQELEQTIIEKEQLSDALSSEAFALIVNAANKLAGPGSSFRAIADDEDVVWDFADLDALLAIKEVLRKTSSSMNSAYVLMEDAVNARREMFELEDDLSELKEIHRPEAEDYFQLTESAVRRRTRRQGG